MQLLPSDMAYPIYRAESRERFETLLRADTRNEAINEFLPVNPDTADQDLRDVLVHGLIGAPDKAELSELLRTGKPTARSPNGWARPSPASWKRWSWRPAIPPTTAPRPKASSWKCWMRTKAAGHAVLPLGMEVAPLLRGLYARQLDGFGREQAEPAIAADTTVEEPIETAKPTEEPTAETPAFHSEPAAVYPGEQNHLPYDVVVERLHIDEPEPTPPEPTPDVEPGEKPDHRFLSRSTASGRPFPTRGQLSRRPIRNTGTICAVTPRTSTSPTTIWARAAPRPSTRPMWRRSSC